MRVITCTLATLLTFKIGLCQPPKADFITLNLACLDQNIQLLNQSLTAHRYEWDICQGDLDLVPSGSVTGTVSGSNIPTGIDVVFDGNNWYAFVTNRNSHAIVRFSLGNDTNTVGTSVNLGNASSLLNLPTDIKIVTDNGKWYGFVYNEGSNIICRLDFGTSLTNTPTATALLNASTSTGNQGLDVVYDGTLWHIVYTFNSKIGVLRLPTIESIPTIADQLLTPNLTGNPSLGDVKIMKYQDSYFAFTASSTTSKLYKLSFGSTILSIPSEADISSALPSTPSLNYFGIDGGYDAGFKLFLSTLQGSIVRINLGDDLTQPPVSSAVLGNLSVFTNNVKNALVKHQSNWYNFSVDFISGNIHKAAFPTPPCQFNPGLLVAQDIILTFGTSGVKYVSLRAFNGGAFDDIANTITISSTVAPSLNFSNQQICLQSPIDFTYSSNQAIVSQTWEFGDAQMSNVANPQHTYSSTGPFTVQLEVQSSNGCSNIASKSIQLYNQPSASFTSPTGLLCTNNQFTFANTTPDNFDGNLSYQWQVDGQNVSTSRDLNITFTTTGAKVITMQASIPGCSDQDVQVTSPVETGPFVDFSVSGKCLAEITNLTNNSSGSIASMSWNFGNGQTSNETSPSVNYSTPGLYPIQLSVTGNNGCVSNKTVNHRIYSFPQPNFNIDLPPFSCSGSPTQFNDLTPALTDSNIQSWLWNFNDAGSTSVNRNPQHTYANSGDYLASLTVTSDQGCENTLTKTITISPSPQPIIDYTPACEDAEVELSDVSGGSATAWRWDIEDALYFTPTALHVFSSPGSYLADLIVTGANGCQASAQVTIEVPQKPTSVDFASEKKCVGTDGLFNAQVTSPFDPIQMYEWKFGAVVREGSSTAHTFTTEGLQEVQLSAVGVSGCVYSITKGVTVLPAPVADFTFNPESGPPPLTIQFSNVSTNATQFKWSFNDPLSTESNVTSPSFTYLALGDYPVDLIASNAEGCQSVVSKLLSVAFPKVDVVITSIQVQQGTNGTIKTLVTLKNNGNVSLQDIPLRMELSNGTVLQEIAPVALRSSQSATHEFRTTLLESSELQYVCVSVVVESNSAPDDNTRACQSFEPFTIINDPYPNPANDNLNIEWLSVIEETIQLTIVDQMGRPILSETIRADAGLNKRHLAVQNLQNGLYFIILKTPGANRAFRTIIAR
jgi:PKD repeat protein